LEVEDEKSLLEWSDSCRGFGGIGGILRYQLDTRSLDEPEIYEDSE
jgi:peptide chain release factor subunit 1